MTPEQLAMIEHFALWSAGVDTIEHYETEADLFRRATGMMAPGKSEPMEMGGQGIEDRRAAWDEWCRERAATRATTTLSLVEAYRGVTADLSALRIEREAHSALLDVTRRDRDALRAQVDELQRLGVSIHKAADAARKAERADVVAWMLSDGPDSPAGLWARATGGSELTCAAAGIESGAHEGAAKEQG